MAINRREFLQAAAAAATTNPLGAALSATDSGMPAAMLALLRRRAALMCSEDTDNLRDLWMEYHERTGTLKHQHLGSVDGDITLLTPAEAKYFKQLLSALKAAYNSRFAKIRGEITTIDQTLAKDPNALAKALKPYEVPMQNTTIDPLPGVDSYTLQDAHAIATGKAPPTLAHETQLAQKTVESMDQLAHGATQAIQGQQTPEWQAKRQQALLRSAQKTLNTLALLPEIRIESSLNKGYGPDRWTIASRFHTHDIGAKEDRRIQQLFKSLTEDLQKAYPDRAKDSKFLVNARPLQPGYGEHDCLRLALTNPDYRLRIILEAAYNLHLQKDAGQSRSVAV